MSNVLYDEPGPKARRRAQVGTVISLVLIAGLLFVAGRRLADRGQFDMELWGPLIDPSNEVFGQVWKLLGEGLVATLTAAVLAIIFSLIIGTLLGSARMMLGTLARIPLVALIELLRGLPVVVTIFYVYVVFQSTDTDIGFMPGDDGLWYLVIGLTLYNSVIIAEILRAGVNSLPSGQREAALAIGMTPRQTMTNVLLPQAFRTMLPALISQLVVVLKDTSIVAVLGLYIELLRQGNLIALNLDNPIQVLFVVGLIFILLNYLLSRVAVWVEQRLSRSRSGGAGIPVDESAVAQT
ncbi:amino acid ABC transporter permease [Nocardioides sp. GCM10027113]|uniref:amino acid ABC transporter permease n=1 Tax=unclassified Nocardioides TaxID=2615069 RepID=UPI00361AFD1F